MPIAIQAVSKQRFEQWTEEAKRQSAGDPHGGRGTAEAGLK